MARRKHGPAARDDLLPVLVFLSGSRRGEAVPLSGDTLSMGIDPSVDIPLPLDTEPRPHGLHATLERRGRSYELISATGAEVWVNGERVDRLVLASGDVLELGRDGAVVRFRLYDEQRFPHKTLPEIFSDCLECVRAERDVGAKAKSLLTVLPRELATRSTLTFRILTVATLIGIAAATSLTARRSGQLEARLLHEVERIEGISALVDLAGESAVDSSGLGEVLTSLRDTDARVRALEAHNVAAVEVIDRGAAATVFLQGSFHFEESEGGRPLRLVLGPNGQPMRNALGQPALSLEGSAPPLEIFVTGTGFTVSPGGHVVTNRHVVTPWDFDEAALGILRTGFQARWTRFVGFLSDGSVGYPASTVLVADEVDLAVIELQGAGEDLPYLEPALVSPKPGDPIVVMGYPLGLRALMARTAPDFVEALRREGVTDFFDQAQRIASDGFMQPLATRGIVGQVTSASVVYDAETTSGGSGGPVLTLDGRVIAVNTAILPEFGGSNLGIPAREVRRLLADLAARTSGPR